jgi:hypothetical protein
MAFVPPSGYLANKLNISQLPIEIMSVQGKVVISNESESNLVQFDHRDSPKIRHQPIIRFQRDIARVFRG